MVVSDGGAMPAHTDAGAPHLAMAAGRRRASMSLADINGTSANGVASETLSADLTLQRLPHGNTESFEVACRFMRKGMAYRRRW